MAGCGALRPAPPPPEARALLAALEGRQARLTSFSLEGRGSLCSPRGSHRGGVFVWAEPPSRLRLEAYGPFGQPALFVVVNAEQVQAINFLEHRFYTGRTSSPRMAAFLPLGLSAGELIGLLEAAPVPEGIRAMHSVPPGEARQLQLAARTRGSALLKVEGAEPAEFLFGEGLQLRAASVGRPGSEVIALYSGWRDEAGLGFPFSLDFSQPATRCSLKLDVSKVRLNEPLDSSTFRLEPPPGYKVIEAS